MIRTLILDDEPLAVRVIEHLLAEVPDVEVVATCTRPVEAASLVRDRNVDLLFLDIEMPGLSGLDFVRALASPPLVVFTTAHREHALEGFDLDAVDYLLKPISLPRLLRALDKARHRLRPAAAPPATGEIHVRADRRLVAIRTDGIAWAESMGDYVILHGGKKPVTSRMTLTDLAAELEPYGFFRIHRSTLVNPAHVTSWSARELTVDGRPLPVGRSFRIAVLDRMKTLDR